MCLTCFACSDSNIKNWDMRITWLLSDEWAVGNGHPAAAKISIQLEAGGRKALDPASAQS